MSEPVHCRTMRVHSHHLHIFRGATVQCDGVGGEVEEMARQALEAKPPLATRIPAAIKRAKEPFAANPMLRVVGVGTGWVTATEVALAEALWKTYRALNSESGEEHWPTPLIAFTEKVEALDA